MIRSLATSRGKCKELVRPIIRHKYEFIHPAVTQEEVNANIKRYKEIHPNAFPCEVSCVLNNLTLGCTELTHSLIDI